MWTPAWTSSAFLLASGAGWLVRREAFEDMLSLLLRTGLHQVGQGVGCGQEHHCDFCGKDGEGTGRGE